MYRSHYCIDGRRPLKVKQEISRQLLLVCFTPNIRNGLASQIRPDAETPAVVQQIKAPLIGTITVTGAAEYEAVMRRSGIQMIRTHGDVSSREEATHPVEVLQAARINYLQLNVQSTLVLTLSDFPKLS